MFVLSNIGGNIRGNIFDVKSLRLYNLRVRKVRNREVKDMKSYLIKDTTKQERIELIRQWVPLDEELEEKVISLLVGIRRKTEKERSIRIKQK